MTPVPASLAYTAREWPPAELFWVMKYGIKMSGMPAWEFRLPDDDLWAIVAFLKVLPTLPPRQYLAMQPPARRDELPRVRANPAAAMPDAERGKTALQQYACVTCHSIPGAVGANAPVGPPLRNLSSRTMLAGLLPNTPEHLAHWIRAPQQVKPGSAMPDLGVTECDARDIAAYLLALE
jgi:mono/diheme cytochrome c family protein